MADETTELPVEQTAPQREYKTIIEDDPEVKPETPEVVPPVEAKPAEVKTEEKVVVVDEYWKKAGEKLGSPYASEDELLNEIRSGRDLKNKFKEVEPKLKEYESLDPLARDIDRAVKSGTDVNLYLEARNMDVEKLNGKEALKKAYLIQNQELVAAGKKDLVDRQFEREYKNKYGALEQKAEDIALLDDGARSLAEQAQQDAQDHLDLAVHKAKRDLGEWKQKNITVVTPNPEDQEKFRQQYLQDVEKSVNELSTMDVTVGDKVFKFGVDGYKSKVKEALSNPVEFLKPFGLDLEKGVIDPTKLKDLVLAVLSKNDIAEPVSKWYLEQNNAQTVRSQINTPAPAKPAPGGGSPQKTEDEEIAEAFAAKRKSQREREKLV